MKQRSESDPLPDATGSFGKNPFEALKGRFAAGDAPQAPRATPQPEPRRAARTPEPIDPAGRVVVRREKKGRAGKTVTRVSGLNLRGVALDELARDMKRALGCGATVEELDVLLQGAQTERAASWLREHGRTDVRIGN